MAEERSTGKHFVVTNILPDLKDIAAGNIQGASLVVWMWDGYNPLTVPIAETKPGPNGEPSKYRLYKAKAVEEEEG